ncbi:uncharacterized protein A4U43_C09F15870 [Asparagus officinalis]|uniref:Uncharacterized protein n=1 Tax=Asparagus officinalis TaxID=4686 RepID=A0A5P1E812_ASPOF|nr:uncharacterized protein A4U43_C09F15870 [Asparagus officinalis]
MCAPARPTPAARFKASRFTGTNARHRHQAADATWALASRPLTPPRLGPSRPSDFEEGEVVSFMKEIGFDGRTIGRILCRYPEIFSANVDNTLRRKVQFLTDFGILRGQLSRVIRKYPELLMLDIHQTLRPSFKCGISHITLLHARLFPAYSAYEAKFFVERSDHIPSCAQMQNMVLPIQDFW